MNEVVNPYQPPAAYEHVNAKTVRDVIRFDGQVSADDIASLIDVPKILYLLRVVAIAVLTPMCILATVFLAYTLVWDLDHLFTVLPVGVVAYGMVAVVLVAERMLSARSRTQRLLKRHPELIGPIRGHLDEFGIAYYEKSVNQIQQVSWTAFPHVTVTRHGIRLDWPASDQFIAVPASCIIDFDEADVRDDVQRFRERCAEPAICQVAHDWSELPTAAIRFQHLVQTQPPLSEKLRVVKRICSVAGGLSIGCFVAAIWSRQSSLVTAVTVVPLIVAMVIEVRCGLHVLQPRYLLRQWGWLTEQGGQTHLPGLNGKFQWTDAATVDINDAQFVVQFPDGSGLGLTPTDLIDGEWSTLKHWLNQQTLQSP